jgi:hypothetical protein
MIIRRIARDHQEARQAETLERYSRGELRYREAWDLLVMDGASARAATSDLALIGERKRNEVVARRRVEDLRYSQVEASMDAYYSNYSRRS